MNSLSLARLMRRSTGPVAILCLVLLWWHYGLLRVPVGMDTLPDSHPPRTVCLIDKRPSRLQPGAVVFVSLPDGSVLLSRVAEALADGSVRIRHDNRDSRFRRLERLGPFAAAAVRGLVLTQFTPGS
ncbi:MAG: hypothetical protein AAF628_23280 [Planctomycetota bacterium]